MAYSTAKRKEVLTLLRTEAGGDTEVCARITEVSAGTIGKWQEAEETLLPETALPAEEEGELPLPAAIKKRIIRRVYEIIETCSDPKKLMDTYEAVSRFERETGQQKESVFDVVARQLSGKG